MLTPFLGTHARTAGVAGRRKTTRSRGNVGGMERPNVTPREQLPFTVFMQGFSAASDRFVSASQSRSRDETFPPLFEALNWAAAVDLRITDRWNADSPRACFWPSCYTHGDVLLGMRYVRNRVHHQWADAFDVSLSGVAMQAEGGFVWRWLPAEHLPPGRDNAFRDQYQRCVAGDLVTRTLQLLTACFREAADDLSLS